MLQRRDPFKNFDRNFAIMDTLVKIFIAVVFVMVFSGFVFMGWCALHPSAVARYEGRMIGEGVRAAQQGYTQGNTAP